MSPTPARSRPARMTGTTRRRRAGLAGVPVGDYAGRVLDVADLIPASRVMTYGDIAEYLGEGGPRQVGRVMALFGGAVPWWRVVRADGRLLAGHERSALERYQREGTPLRRAAGGGQPRLDMSHARWSPAGVPFPGRQRRQRGGRR